MELEAEHVDFDTELDLLDIDSPELDERVTRLLRSLSHHVDQENLGIFPVASVTLSAAGWDMVATAQAPPDPAARDGAASRSGLDTAGRTAGGGPTALTS